MTITKSIKSIYKLVKLKLPDLLIILGFLAALITVCSFIYQAFRWFQGDWRNSDFYHWMRQSTEAVVIMGLYLTVACVVLWRCYQLMNRPWRRLKMGRLFVIGLGLQIVLSLPMGLWQTIHEQYWVHFNMKVCPGWLRLLTPLTHWPINVAGYTVHCVFESFMGQNSRYLNTGNAIPLMQLLFFTLFAFSQASMVSLAWAWRYKQCRKVSDWGLATVLILFLGNAVMWFFMS